MNVVWERNLKTFEVQKTKVKQVSFYAKGQANLEHFYESFLSKLDL